MEIHKFTNFKQQIKLIIQNTKRVCYLYAFGVIETGVTRLAILPKNI